MVEKMTMRSRDRLKTLEDINPATIWDRNKFSVRENIVKLYSDIDLKKAAINKIKTWRRYLSDGVWIRLEGGYLVFESDNIKKNSDYTLIGSISCFVRFFNITDEDLNM
jgi:hypothetical protein